MVAVVKEFQRAGLRNRIVAVTAPWMAPANSFQGEPEAFERTIFFKSFNAILGAGRCEPAFRAKERR